MKIIYKDNPLTSIVELDAHDKEIFKLKIKIAEMQERIFEAHFSLEEGSTLFDLNKARQSVHYDYYVNDNGISKLDKRVDMLYNEFLNELQSSHHGDCTCFPGTCMKCYSESLLNINTIPYLNKHEGSNIHGYFSGNNKSIDEALSYFKSRKVVATEDWHTPHLKRWQEENDSAYIWLLNYKEKYLKC